VQGVHTRVTKNYENPLQGFHKNSVSILRRACQVGTPELVKLKRNIASLHRESASAQVSLKNFRIHERKVQGVHKANTLLKCW
jgi:hypothetical protein